MHAAVLPGSHPPCEIFKAPLLCPSCNADTGESSKFCPACGSTVVRAADEDDYVGAIVAKKYRVEQMIGEGGMGKVYRAKQLALDKPVVLKVLRQSLLSDERTVARFQREARAASRLNHPNSISILDFGQNDDGAMYIAMEFVAGKDLHHILSKEWPLPESRLVRMVSQILSALSDAHGAGVIHRDLKPENIMVEQRRGEPDFVKVLDFGIAKIQDSEADDGPALTRAGFVCGTPEYMSPEQARGATLDARSDLYAVGVILYQLTAGVLPFESDSAVGFATKHLTEEPIAPSRKRPDVRISPALERLILRALAKNPADRPQTADAFKAELLALEGGGAGRLATGTLTPRRLTPEDQAATTLTADSDWARTAPGHAPLALTSVVTGSGLAPVTQRPWFKALTLVLVVAAVGATAWVVRGELRRRDAVAAPSVSTPDPAVSTSSSALTPSDTVPAATMGATTTGSAPSSLGRPENSELGIPLYEMKVSPLKRDSVEASRLAREGDQAYRAGNVGLAATRYKEAFEQDPLPELSLKLGELHWQRNQTQEARGWWKRHLKDQTDSKARRYIQHAFSDLGAAKP